MERARESERDEAAARVRGLDPARSAGDTVCQPEGGQWEHSHSVRKGDPQRWGNSCPQAHTKAR